MHAVQSEDSSNHCLFHCWSSPTIFVIVAITVIIIIQRLTQTLLIMIDLVWKPSNTQSGRDWKNSLQQFVRKVWLTFRGRVDHSWLPGLWCSHYLFKMYCCIFVAVFLHYFLRHLTWLPGPPKQSEGRDYMERQMVPANGRFLCAHCSLPRANKI